MYSISKLNYLKQNSNFSIRRSSCFVLKPSQPKRIKKGKISPVLDFQPFLNRCPSLVFVQLWCTRVSSETCRQSFKDCTLEQLGAFSLLPLFGLTVGIYFDHFFLFSFSRISLITGIILRCSEWESSTNSIRWRRTFQLSPKISWIDIRLH